MAVLRRGLALQGRRMVGLLGESHEYVRFTATDPPKQHETAKRLRRGSRFLIGVRQGSMLLG